MSVKTRIGKLWAAHTARKQTGPKLTYPGETYLHRVNDADAIEAARAEGRPVIEAGDLRWLAITRASAWNERPVIIFD